MNVNCVLEILKTNVSTNESMNKGGKFLNIM